MFYWLYDLPNWLFGTIVVGVFVLFGVSGLYLTRRHVRRLHKVDHSHNDIVGMFLAAITVFYGITLGLVAVGTWQNFTSVSDKVDQEAQIIASLYRDTSSYQDPWKSQLHGDLKDYMRNVIDVGWPLQRQGIVPAASGAFLTQFQSHLQGFQPSTFSGEILQSEVFKQYNDLVQARRSRLNSVTNGIPGQVWVLVIVGGLITLVVAWFFDVRSLAMHVWMMVMLSGLLGLLIFLIAALDNPFRGGVSITPQAIETVYQMVSQAN